MRVRIKTWDEMEEEFGLEAWGAIHCVSAFTPQLEKLIPRGRVINIPTLSTRWKFGGYNITADMIAEYLDEAWLEHSEQRDAGLTTEERAHLEDWHGSDGKPDQPEKPEETPGGSTPSQYALPSGAIELQDLIEHRRMNFARGNIFKAVYRAGHCEHSDEMRDLQKVLYFVKREIARLEREIVGDVE